MHVTWIVAADKARVRVFETIDTYNFREIEEIANAPGDSSDCRDTQPNRQQNFESYGPIAHQRNNALKNDSVPIINAASQLLNNAYSEHRYEKLRLLAAVEELDSIRSSLSKEAQLCIELEEEKDISWFDAKAVKDYIRHDLQL